MQRRLLPLSFILCFGVGCGKIPPAERAERDRAQEEQLVDMRRWEARQRDAIDAPQMQVAEEEPALD